MSKRRKRKQKRKADGIWLTLAITAFITMSVALALGGLTSSTGTVGAIGAGVVGMIPFFCAMLPGQWLEQWRVFGVLTGLMLFLSAAFSGTLFSTHVFQICAFWIFHGLALLVFAAYGLVILRRAADEKKATGRMFVWWMVYPSVALMLGAGVGFFELQRLGLSWNGGRKAIQHGLIPFGLVVFLALTGGLMNHFPVRARRLVMLVSGALILCSTIGRVIIRWYAGGS